MLKLVERENLAEIEGLLRAYLDAGAPLGRIDEVRSFLDKQNGVQKLTGLRARG